MVTKKKWIHRLASGALLVAALTACGGGDSEEVQTLATLPETVPVAVIPPTEKPKEPQQPIKMARSVESLRCEANTRFRIPDMESAIVTAGLDVRSRSCAWNGWTYPAACGTAIPFYRVIEVSQDQVEKAGTLGYKALTEFPVLLSTPCPNQDPPVIRTTPKYLENGLVENSYIVTFKPATATVPSVIWPPTSDPALKAALPVPRMGEHGTAQSRTELAAEFELKGQVISIFTSINAAHIEMDAAEAEKLKSDPRVLHVEQDARVSAGG